VASTELITLSAVDAVAALRNGDVKPSELVEAAATRIEAVEPKLNALPILALDQARDAARKRESAGVKPSDHPADLAGLPIAIKDLIDVKGLLTTYGCPLYKDNIATKSDPLVTLLESRGATVIAKSNSPEFGMLPVSDNRVFGATATPYAHNRTSGGSSGGAAAAVGAGEVWLAHGSDVGGSLRIPAAFCGVVGIRPSPGRVPRAPSKRGFSPLSVQGPMARSVGDVALFLDAMAAHAPGDPLTQQEILGQFQQAVREARPPKRIAFATDLGLGGVDPEVEAIARAAFQKFSGMGAVTEETRPDFGRIDVLFQRLISFNYLTERAEFADANRDKIEPVHGILVDAARKMTIEQLAEAQHWRADLYTRMATFFEDFEALVTPTVGVVPFAKDLRGGANVDEWAGSNPPRWFHQCWGTVPLSNPILAIPAGFTKAGLPVSVQIIAPQRREDMALAYGKLLEDALALPTNLPKDPVGDV
jgi:amidase